MNEIVRLVRIGLTLRVFAGLIALGRILWLGIAVPPGVLLAASGGSVLLLIITSISARHIVARARHVRWLLLALMMALTIEAAVAVTWLRPYVPSAAPFIIPTFFLVIPILLGAWLEGHPGWWRWWLMAVLLSLPLVLLQINTNPDLREEVGWLPLAQALVTGVVCYFVGSLASRERLEQHKLAEANRQLSAQARLGEDLAASRERVRIARELHDTMAHSLAGLVVQLDAATLLAGDATPALHGQLRQARAAAKNGLAETRAAIGNLRSAAVQEMGLAEALRQWVDNLPEAGRVRVEIECAPDVALAFGALPPGQGETLFRIAQEAITNALRHAAAGTVRISMMRIGDALRLRIADDGKGFDTAVVDIARYGIRGMRERADSLRGRLMIQSERGVGTRVDVTVQQEQTSAVIT